MKFLPNILYVVGVCIAVVGGAGFHNPTETGRDGVTDRASEKLAWPLFGGGMVMIALGGVVRRAAKADSTSPDGEQTSGAGDDHMRLISTIRDTVAELDDKKNAMPQQELCARIDDLLNGAFFDLVDKREALLDRLGFADYAKVWEGVATAERQLARVWSIATDGHLAQALEDLPAARVNIDRALQAMSDVQRAPIP